LNQCDQKSSIEEPPQVGDEFITILNQSPDHFSLNKEKLISLTKEVLGLFQLNDYELTISIVSESEIHDLNKQYRSKDKPTDVLSFPQTTFTSPITRGLQQKHTEPHNILGDIVICLDFAKVNAASIGNSLGRELAFLIVHGILHLGGHDHNEPEEEKIMIAEQQFVITHLSDYISDTIFSDLVREGRTS
jgi:probable rRNA maturation factor